MTNQAATFESIKDSLIETLKSDNRFKDYNYESSNISAFLNLLSKNTLFNIYYIKMLFNEISPSTATNIDSLNGYSSRIGHLIKKVISAKSSLKLTIPNTNNIDYIHIPKGTKFTGKNSNGDLLTFITMVDYTLTSKNVDGNITGDVIVTEGVVKTHTFQSISTKTYYTIKDNSIDVNTIELSVKKTPTTTFENVYTQFNNTLPNKNDNVYYLKYNGLYYSVFFGGDVFGYQPKDGEVIQVKFLSSVGSSGNGVYKFDLITTNTSDVNDINHYPTTLVSSNGQSSGGRSDIEVDELKKILTTFNLSRVVAITPTDYKSVIIDNFGDISSISVWGGQDSDIRSYGKWFVSIKPILGDTLSEVSKQTIKDYLQKNHSVVNDDVVFVDPEFTDVIINIQITRNSLGRQIDKNQILSSVITLSNEFSKNKLGKFETLFSYVDYVDYVTKDIKSYYSKFFSRVSVKQILKLNGLNKTYDVKFNNPISTFSTSVFKYGSNNAYFTILNNGSDIQDIRLYVNDVLVDAKFGSVDIINGHISLFVPDNVLTDKFDIIVSPVNNDVDSSKNNIIRISHVEVDVRWEN